jgi:hypothetical protein
VSSRASIPVVGPVVGLLVGLLVLDACGTDTASSEDAPVDLPDLPFVRDLELTKFTVNQGVEIELFDDGEAIDPPDRRSRVIENRAALFRAEWVLPESWEPRSVRAQLTLHIDGEPVSASDELMLQSDAEPQFVGGTFQWLVPAELMVPDMEFELAVMEIDESLAEGPLDGPVPYVAPQPLGVEAGPRVMDVMIVPVDHQLADPPKECSGPPVFDEAELEKWAGHLLGANPAERVDIQVREPVVWTDPMTDFSPVLAFIRDVREMDDAPPNRYYFGALDPCDWGSQDGWAGLGSRPRETTIEEAFRRASIGVVGLSGTSTRETFVHEIGHNQERFHVLCAGNEGNPVLEYPHPDGEVGVYGFDIVDFALSPPTMADYMTYCGPTWVSDFGWNLVMPVIETLSSWDAADMSGVDSKILVGLVSPQGNQSWSVLRGDIVLPAATEQLEYWDADRLLETVPMQVQPLEDGTLEFVAPLPGSGMNLDGVVEIRLADRAMAIARDTVREPTVVRPR